MAPKDTVAECVFEGVQTLCTQAKAVAAAYADTLAQHAKEMKELQAQNDTAIALAYEAAACAVRTVQELKIEKDTALRQKKDPPALQDSRGVTLAPLRRRLLKADLSGRSISRRPRLGNHINQNCYRSIFC